MKEVRCIVFSNQELLSAVVDFRRQHHLAVPLGTVNAIVSQITADRVATTIDVVDDDARSTVLHIDSEEIAACLINYCLGRRIPLPRRSEKHFEIIEQQLGLVMKLTVIGANIGPG